MRTLACMLLAFAGCNGVLDIEDPREGTSDLAVSMSAQPGVASGMLEYAVTVRNTGGLPARSIIAVITLPAEVSEVTVTSGWQCTSDANVVTCTLDEIPFGPANPIAVRARAPSEATILVAMTRVTTETPELDDANNTATTMTAITSSADLAIAVVSPQQPVVAGEPISYAIDISNLGPSTATEVAVTLAPTGTTITSTAGSGWACTTSQCSLATPLAVGSAQRLTVTVQAGGAGMAQLTANVAATSADPQPSNNTASTTTPIMSLADLAIEIADSPDPASVGGSLMYTITVQNDGPSDATTVVVTDPLPAGFILDMTSGLGWICSATSGTVTCSRGVLPSGVSSSIVLAGHLLGAGNPLTNTASVSAVTADPVSTNNSATASTTVLSAAELSISMTDAPDPVRTGDNFSYSITVQNGGPLIANNVVVTDPLPTGTTFVSASGAGWSCSFASPTVTCTRAQLAIGIAPAIALVVTAPPMMGLITNTASVNATTGDSYPLDNSASVTTTIAAPPLASANLDVAITDSPDPLTAGGVITYTVTVHNSGPDPANGVFLSNELPAQVTFANASGGTALCWLSVSNVRCMLGNIAAGSSLTITIKGVAQPGATSLLDTAAVSSNTPDPVMANNSAIAITSVLPACTMLSSGTFAAPTVYAAGNDPHAVAVGDLDGDALLDVVVANINDAFANPTNPGTISVFLANSNGTLKPPATYAAGYGPNSVSIGDLDGDLDLDLVVTNYAGNGAVLIFPGNGDGTFGPFASYPAFANPRAAAIGDLDRDGRPDLAIAISNVGKVLVLKNGGSSGFYALASYPVASDAYSVAIADFDRDGKLDVVATSFPNTGSVSVLRGNGDGTLQASAEYPAGTNPVSVVPADVDGDAIPDLVVANYGSNNLSILIGNGDGTFRAPIHYATGQAPFMVGVGDTNDDGILDLVVVNHSSNDISVLRGNGNGTFQAAVSYSVGLNPRAVALGDLDNDCVLDVVTANFGADNATVRLGAP